MGASVARVRPRRRCWPTRTRPTATPRAWSRRRPGRVTRRSSRTTHLVEDAFVRRTAWESAMEFLRAARIVGAMAGMLSAIPKTPLDARLEAEGRLDNAAVDDPKVTTNVIPLRMSSEELRDAWVDLMVRLYEAEND